MSFGCGLKTSQLWQRKTRQGRRLGATNRGKWIFSNSRNRRQVIGTLTFTAFLFVSPTGGGQTLSPSSNRIQVGNLVFDFPPNMHITADWTDHRSEFRFKYPPEMRDPTAKQVDGLTIYGKDIWPISGTHSRASKWEYGDIQLSLIAMNSDVRNALCQQWQKYRPELATARNADFYIFEEDNPSHSGHRLAVGDEKFFGAPIVTSTINSSHTKTGEQNSYGTYYSVYQPISKNVSVQVRASDTDLRDISLFEILKNLERNIHAWVVPTDFSPKALGFDDKSICSP